MSWLRFLGLGGPEPSRSVSETEEAPAVGAAKTGVKPAAVPDERLHRSGFGRIFGSIFSDPVPETGLHHVSYGGQSSQFAHLRVPDGPGPHPVVVLLHGGFWRKSWGSYRSLEYAGRALREAGIASYNIEYRRIGEPGGGWPGTIQDVARATDRLRELASEHHLALDQLIAVGHSAGGQLALWLAARAKLSASSELASPDPLPVHGVVSLAGVSDLERALDAGLGMDAAALFLALPASEKKAPNGVHAERIAAASPRALLPLGVPQVLIHGTDDHWVPHSMSSGYRDHAISAGDPAKLVTLEGGNHEDLIHTKSDEWSTVLAEIREMLGALAKKSAPHSGSIP